MELGILLLGLVAVLTCAEIFTNGIEWVGKRLGLGEGAVGSVLAAVGTALPETSIPLIAFIFQGEKGEDIGLGAILGAPFMLGTLAFFVVGITVLAWPRRKGSRSRLLVDTGILRRDLRFFLLTYTLAIIGAFFSMEWKPWVAVLLLGLYGYYLWQTLGNGPSAANLETKPLHFARRYHLPPWGIILFQVGVALVGMAIGAHYFVVSLETIAPILGIPPLVLSLIVAPVATELPEKFNSILWLKEGKDTLAMGNITGAMVFQSSCIPAMGILLSPWVFTQMAFISCLLALASAAFVYFSISRRGYLGPGTLLWGGGFYSLFMLVLWWMARQY